MSSPNATKIFGIRLGVDPKILAGGLIAIAAALFWYNSRADEGGAPVNLRSAAPSGETGATGAAGRKAPPSRRSAQSANDRSILRMRPIDATKGDVDPTLHLGLLSRLGSVEEGKIGRSVFEIGALPQSAAAMAAIKGPKIPVAPIPAPAVSTANVPPPVNIPFKYYGYAKPGEPNEANRGLFLDDGDNVVVATEGQTMKGRYLIVELTPRQARVEDTQVRQSKDLPVTPLAQP